MFILVLIFIPLYFHLYTGRKSGKGCFVYTPGVKDREVNAEAENIMKKYSVTPAKQ